MDVTGPREARRVVCRFCSLLAGASDVFESTWLHAEGYRAMVSVGALVPGWTLVCPVDHVINLSSHYKRSAFWSFASTAAHVLEDRYGPCAFFEHGAGAEGSSTGCGVGHAHGHLVPLALSLEGEARRVAPHLDWVKCPASDIGAVASDREYLFVAEKFAGAQSVGSLCILEEPTSQFFRRLIAQMLGVGDLYDYKKYPMLEIASKSSQELRNLVGPTLVGA